MRRTGAAVEPEVVLDMRAALARLPRRQRATLVLRFYCDLTVEQAAELLGCSSGTVKSQTSKGLDALRRAPEVGAFMTGGEQAAQTAHGAHLPRHREERGHG